MRFKRFEQQAEPAAMLGRHRHGVAKSKCERFDTTRLAGPALTLVGDQHDRNWLAA